MPPLDFPQLHSISLEFAGGKCGPVIERLKTIDLIFVVFFVCLFVFEPL